MEIGAKQTADQYRTPEGNYIPEREMLHREILAKIFTTEEVKRATPPAGQQPQFVYLGGRAGAGKSVFISGPTAPIDGTKFIVINADTFKEMLPGYNGANAALYHEESSDIAARAHGIAQRLGVNVICDATMRTASTARRLLGEYMARGYQATGYFIHTAPQISAARVISRFMRTGRYVPPEYTLGSLTNEHTFDQMRDQFSNWRVYDNNGTKPKLIAQGGR